MRGFSKLLAIAAIAVAFAAPAAAAGPNGGAVSQGFGGGAPNSGGAGPVLPSPGGDGVTGPRAPSGPSHAPEGVLPPSAGGPNAGFKGPNPGGPNPGPGTPRHRVPPPIGFVGHGPGVPNGDDWRRRPRHYWLGGGPIFVPDPSGDYVYSDVDYDDGSDPTDCWVYRKIYDRAGRFLGFVHVDLCEGQ